MSIFAIVCIAVVCVCFILILKQTKKEYAYVLSLLVCSGIFIWLMQGLSEILDYFLRLISFSQISAVYLEVLIKVLGVGYLTQFAVTLCKDAGESAIAAKVELAGKVAVLLLSLPVFEYVLDLFGQLLA